MRDGIEFAWKTKSESELPVAHGWRGFVVGNRGWQERMEPAGKEIRWG